MRRLTRHISRAVLLVVVNLAVVFSQNVDIRGTVTDSSNGERIAFVTIVLKGTNRGAASNTSGFYLIPNVTPGKYTIIASCVGYLRQEITLLVRSGDLVLMNFRLTPEPVKVSETVVTGGLKKELSEIQTSVHVMQQDDIRAVPVSVQPDVFRALQILPGIVSTSDVNTHFYVRGGAGDQNLILLDGMKVFNPFHAMGLFSIFDPDVVRTTEVYTGAFPPGYGGRLSSVVSMSTKDGNARALSGRANVNFLSSKVQLEGPWGPNFRWVANGRKSFTSKTINTFLQKDSPVSFYDAFLKLTRFDNEEGSSRYGIEGFYSGDDLRSSDPENPDYTWRNHAVGFSGSGLIEDRFFVDVVVYESFFEAHRDAKASAVITPASTSVQEVAMRANATVYTNTKDVYFFGAEFSFPRLEYSLVNSYGIQQQKRRVLVDSWFWFRYQTTLGLWQVDGGIHADLGSMIQQIGFNSIEPRINVSRPLFEDWKLKLSYGRFSQKLLTVNNEDDVISVFDTWISLPEGLKPEHADHLVVGVDGTILPMLSANVQTYYKYYGSLVSYNRNKIGAQDPDYVSSRGSSTGAEILVRYAFRFGDLFAAYTLSSATITAGDLSYTPRYDRRHSLNLLTSLHVAEDVLLTLRWEYGSGFPYSQSVGTYDRLSLQNFFLKPFAYETGQPYITLGPKNASRLPAYHRLDASLSYNFQMSQFKGSLGINIANLYDRHNLFYFDRKTGRQTNMLPFFPSATLEIEF